MSGRRGSTQRRSRRAFWEVIDRAVHGGWGATLRLALLLVVLVAGTQLLSSEGGDMAHWAITQSRNVLPGLDDGT